MKNLSKHPIHSVVLSPIDKYELEYYYINKGKGETIFLLHGFPDTAGAWDQWIDVLSQKYHCVAPFLRGYYPTAIPLNNDYSVYTIANDINQLAKQLGITKYYVIGQDWGASIAYCMTNLFPKQVINTCAIAMPHPLYLKPSFTLLYKARHILLFINKKRAIEKIKQNDFEYIETLYKRWSPNWENYNKSLGRIIFCLNRRKRVIASLGYYWSLKKSTPENTKIYKQLPQKQILVLVGAKDGTIDFKQFHKMKKEVNHFKVITHKNAGHFINHEDPLFCLTRVLSFFQNQSIQHTVQTKEETATVPSYEAFLKN